MSERQAKAPTMRALLPSRLVPEDMLSEWQGPNLPNTKNYAPSEDSIGGMIRNALLSGVAGVGGFTGLPMSDEGNRAALLGELLAAGMPLVGGVKQLAKLVGAENKVAQGIKAFHGSPHDFDQFSLSKIGTGEGAQAYGHGLYFAESPDVAQIYRETLGGDGIHFPGGAQKQFAFETPEGVAQDTLKGMGAGDRDMESVYAASRQHLQDLIDRGYGFEHGGVEKNKAALKVLDQWQKQGATYGTVGRTYEVNINADPEDFLDWDAPLSQQSEKVRQAIQAAGVKPENKMLAQLRAQHGGEYPTGADTYAAAKRAAGGHPVMDSGAGATEALKQAGIPGIKYLDGASRMPKFDEALDIREYGGGYMLTGKHASNEFFKTKQEAISALQKLYPQSRNYVVFDDKLISIVKKYGIAGALSAGAINELEARQLQAQGYQ